MVDLSARQYAKHLGIHAKTVKRRIQSGEIDGYQDEKNRYFVRNGNGNGNGKNFPSGTSGIVNGIIGKRGAISAEEAALILLTEKAIKLQLENLEKQMDLVNPSDLLKSIDTLFAITWDLQQKFLVKFGLEHGLEQSLIDAQVKGFKGILDDQQAKMEKIVDGEKQ